jgi:hypothetical protein
MDRQAEADTFPPRGRPAPGRARADGQDTREANRQNWPSAELAAKQIESMIDPSEERDRRQRRLTKGPLEFREDRVDQPKAKGRRE